jgi:hypothetical protein
MHVVISNGNVQIASRAHVIWYSWQHLEISLFSPHFVTGVKDRRLQSSPPPPRPSTVAVTSPLSAGVGRRRRSFQHPPLLLLAFCSEHDGGLVVAPFLGG